MKELNITYGVNICIDAKGPRLYIVGHSVEETIEFLARQGNVYYEVKWNAMGILRKAQECNAGLCELQSIYRKGKLCISFEFETWEDFLRFKQIMEEHSQ